MLRLDFRFETYLIPPNLYWLFRRVADNLIRIILLVYNTSCIKDKCRTLFSICTTLGFGQRIRSKIYTIYINKIVLQLFDGEGSQKEDS